MINIGVNIAMCHTLLFVVTDEMTSMSDHANKAIKTNFSITKKKISILSAEMDYYVK